MRGRKREGKKKVGRGLTLKRDILPFNGIFSVTTNNTWNSMVEDLVG